MTASLRALAGSLRNLYTLGAANRRRSKLGSLIVPTPTSLLKRLVVGRPFRSDRLSHTLLPKRIALPIFASDPLSSVAYATDFILATLVVAGIGAFTYAIPISLVIATLLAIVAFSYRQTIHAYPTGGGAYIDADTRALMRAKAVTVWLRAELDVLFDRVRRRGHRPLLRQGDPKEVLGRLMTQRYPIYAEADIIVDSTAQPADRTTEQVIDALRAFLIAEKAKVQA